MINLNYLTCDNNLESPIQQIKDVPSSYNIIVISNVIRKCIRTAPKETTTFSDSTKSSHTNVLSKQIKTLKNRCQTAETRQKMSEATKRLWENPETRQKILEARKRALANPEARQKRSEASKRLWENPETRQKILEARKRTLANPETRQKILEKRALANPEARQKRSEAVKRAWANPETRQKILEKRALANPEARQKRSEASKRVWANPETRQKILESKQRALANPEARQKMSEAAKRVWANPEARQKRSEVSKRVWANPETRQKILESKQRALENPETRQKMSEASKRFWANPETRQKILESKQRALENPETRQKMSEASKRVWANPETRQKILESKQRALENPETRQKMSESAKRAWANPEIRQKILEDKKVLSRQRADQAIDYVLGKTCDEIKIEAEEELLPKGDHELQMTGFSNRIHQINNSLPVLQDLNCPSHSLLYQQEGSIDQIKISQYGDLELSSLQKKQMLEEVREWIKINENNRELYQQKFDELFEISIPIEIGPHRGFSVYAKRNIRKFEVVGPYAGILQRSEEELNRSMRKKGSYNVLSYLFSTRSKNRTIDAYNTGNTLSLINTGQLPGKPLWNQNNLATIRVGKNLNFYIAKRDILQGEELLVDYGPDYNPMYFLKAEKED